MVLTLGPISPPVNMRKIVRRKWGRLGSRERPPVLSLSSAHLVQAAAWVGISALKIQTELLENNLFGPHQ